MRAQLVARLISAAATVLLALLFAFGLPPRATADVVGLVAAVAAHLASALLLERVAAGNKTSFAGIGIAVTAVLYWLAAVGTVLLWRLLTLSSITGLVALQLGYLAAAALLVGLYAIAAGKAGRGEQDEKPYKKPYEQP